MKKAIKLCGLIVLTIAIISLLAGHVSAEAIIIDTEKGVPGFRTEPARDLPGNWQYLHDHPDTSADGWFDTNAYPPRQGNGSFWYAISFPDMDECKGIWMASLPHSGNYEVFAWIPDPNPFDPYLDESTPPSDYLPTKKAQYKIFHNDGVATVTIDQNVNRGGFTSLSVFDFDSTARVELSSNGVEFWRCVAFDAVKFVPVESSIPERAPTRPLAGFVHNINTSENFSTIQAAISDSDTLDGHTITVDPGTYIENVDVNKRLTIKSENGAATAIVQAANPNDHVFAVTVAYVNISGFTVEGATDYSQAGIYLNRGEHCNISNNNASDNSRGIYLEDSNNNTLANNNASNKIWGIHLEDSNNNTLTNNNASNNIMGIHLGNSNNNTLTNNNASDNSQGIYLADSNNNTLTNNNASDNNLGITLEDSNNNTLTNNNASNNIWGIYLKDSSNNILTNNNALYNDVGICLGSHSADNEITKNNAYPNERRGIESDFSSTRNRIYMNNFDGGISTPGSPQIEFGHPPLFLHFRYSQGVLVGATAYAGFENIGGSGTVNIMAQISYDSTIIAAKGNTFDVKSNTTYPLKIEIKLSVEEGFGEDYDLTLSSPSASSSDEIGLGRYKRLYASISAINVTTSTNFWNSTGKINYTYKGKTYTNCLGNYWTDYDGIDANGDGIGDTPYPIISDNDSYPLMERFEGYNILPARPPEITSFAPPSHVNDIICNWRTFNVTVDQMANVSWYLNDTLQHTNVSVREAKCTLHAAVAGEHNVTANASNANGRDRQTWVWNVTPSAPSKIIYPDFTDTDTPGSWRTWIGVMNTGDANTTLNLTIYNQDGSLAYSNPDFVTLEPKAAHFFRPGITAGIAQGSTIVSGDTLAGTCHESKNDGDGAKVYTAVISSSPTLYYPDFTDTDTIGNWRTWMGVVNAGDTSTTVRLDVYNPDGSLAYSNANFVTLEPKAAHFFRPGITAGIAQGCVVVSGANLAGTCHVNKNGGEGTKVYTALASGSSTLYYPDFTDTDTIGNWRTWLGVMNTGAASTTLNLTIYNPDGSLAYSNANFITLEPKAAHFFRPGITAGIAQGDVVVSGDNLAGTCHVNKNGGEGTKAYTALSSGSSTLNYPDFTDTDTSGNWRTWMGVMNTGAASTTVRLDVYNADGSLAYSNANFVTLEPKAAHFFRPGITAGIAQGDVVVSGDNLAGTCHVNKNGGVGTKVYTAIGG